jgi:hypothetical protein
MGSNPVPPLSLVDSAAKPSPVLRPMDRDLHGRQARPSGSIRAWLAAATGMFGALWRRP